MNTDRIFLLLVPLLRPLVARKATRRRAAFAAQPPAPGRVVFLGDSITQRGTWNTLLPELNTLNRGIDGDTTQDVLARLDGPIEEPVAVSLMVGTNDLHTTRELKDPAGIASRVEQIVLGIRERAPQAAIFLNSLTPRTAHFASRVKAINEEYRKIAGRTNATYVDLWPALANADGALRRTYTFDNLHLSKAGYEAWRDVLRPLLAPFAENTDEKER